MRDISEIYNNNNLSAEILSAKLLLEWLEERHGDLDEIDLFKMDSMIESLVQAGKNTVENFIFVMRYYRMTKRHDIYIHLTRYTGFLDVIESILARLK